MVRQAPLTVMFQVTDPCPVWQHIWTFGDGPGGDNVEVDGSISTVTHTYTRCGTNTVILIEDDGRLEYGTTKENYVAVTGDSGTVSSTPFVPRNSLNIDPGICHADADGHAGREDHAHGQEPVRGRIAGARGTGQAPAERADPPLNESAAGGTSPAPRRILGVSKPDQGRGGADERLEKRCELL